MTDYLCHFGVLGMKWGIRRYRNKDGTLTDAGKQRYSKPMDAREAFKNYKAYRRGIKAQGAAAWTLGLATAVPTSGLSLVLKDVALDRLNHKVDILRKEVNDVKLGELYAKPGETFSRISSEQDESSKKNMYVSLTGDNENSVYYRNTWPKIVREIQHNPNLKFHANSFEAKTELRAPSYEKRKQMALSLVKNNKALYKELGEKYVMDQLRAYTRRFGLKKVSDYYGKEDAKIFSNRILGFLDSWMKEGSDNAFRAFTAVLPTSPKLMKKYTDSLKKDGYNMVFDDNSMSASAFIVFDTKASFKQTSSSSLNI